MSKSRSPIEQLENLTLKPSGLYTYPNSFSEVPQGALIEAINVVIDRPHVIEQRRGIGTFGSDLLDTPTKFFPFQNRLILSAGTSLKYDADGTGAWTSYTGSYSAPSSALKIHSFLANKNIYFTTSTGIKKLDTLAGTIVASGAPQGLDGSGTTTGSGWFTNNTQVAYRIVFGYTDLNNNLILGAPSQRIIVSNSSGGATNVSLTFTLPAGLSTSWIYQIYRSPISADLSTEPNDECSLAYTGSPSSSDLSAGTVTITDNVPDSLKGAFIYTASSQQGITQANNQPPIATDATEFKGFAMLANTTAKQQIFLTLVSVGSPNLQLNDTVTIGGVTYTAKSSETIASGYFKLSTGGTPSQNITDTANSLVRVINRYTSNTTVYAYYVSGYSDLPGRIILAERGIGAASFTAASTRAGAFVPDIGTTTQTSITDGTFAGKNVIAIAKFQQPEAFPASNIVKVGAADKAILRIIALRDYVLIFKEDGVFQIVGTDLTSFAVQEVDRTTNIQGIETAVALNNKVFLFSNQTVISMSFNEGATLKALPIKKDLLVISSPLYPGFSSASYGVSYESDNKYILFTVTATTDTTATQAYVYNYLTDSWTTWELPIATNAAIVNPADDKLYFASATVDSITGSYFVYQERKNFDETDYGDVSYTNYIISASGAVVTTETSVLGIVSVGDKILQGTQSATILSIVDNFIGQSLVTVDRTTTWTTGDPAGLVYFISPIEVSLKFVLEACGNPGIIKHFKEVHTIFSNADFAEFQLGFYTDFYSAINRVSLVPKASTGYGLPGWGEFPWGSGAPEAQVIRGIVPLNQRRGHWLNLVVNYADALTTFALDGFAIFYSKTAQRFK
jgi:hypothetical protein